MQRSAAITGEVITPFTAPQGAFAAGLQKDVRASRGTLFFILYTWRDTLLYARCRSQHVSFSRKCKVNSQSLMLNDIWIRK
jgi:hypothetical protein